MMQQGIDVEDPAKMPPQPQAPRMGIGERIVGIANNFLQGAAGHFNHGPGGRPIYTGPGATSNWHSPLRLAHRSKGAGPTGVMTPATGDHNQFDTLGNL